MRVSHCLDPDQDLSIVRYGFGPNCLQRISALIRISMLVPPGDTYRP